VTGHLTGWSAPPLRRRLTWVFAVVAVLLLTGGALGYAAVSGLRSSQQNLYDQLFRAYVGSADLSKSVLDQETGVRGYVLTGREGFLEPYEDGIAAERAAFDSLIRIVIGSPQLYQRVDSVVEASAAWRSQFAEPAIAAVRADGRRAVSEEQQETGRQLFDELRGALTALQGGILDARVGAVADVNRATDLLAGVLLAGLLGVVAAGAALWLALRAWVTGPLERLGAEVRQVSTDQLGHRVSVGGPPEVVGLAADVERMRVRIVEEYAAAVAARREAQQAAQVVSDQAQELRRSNAELEQFAYVASHDLQEPLRKVASFCQMLERRYKGQLDERADQYIGFAVEGAKRMQLLINDLLAFSRVGRSNAGFAPVDLEAVLDTALSSLETARQDSGVEVTWDPLPTVAGEASLLTQVFQNLIANAIKFRGQDPPRVHVAVEQLDGEWRFSCSDNGMGIEPRYAERVFVIFQRLHGRDVYDGTGIGLALCRKIVEYHGGRIWLDTERVSGTTVQWTLPVMQPATPADRKPEERVDAGDAGAVAVGHG